MGATQSAPAAGELPEERLCLHQAPNESRDSGRRTSLRKTLRLCFSLSHFRGRRTLFFKELGKKEMSCLQVRIVDTVLETKAQLGAASTSTLIFGTQQLQDTYALQKYAITDGSILEVWPALDCTSPRSPSMEKGAKAALVPHLDLTRVGPNAAEPLCKNVPDTCECKSSKWMDSDSSSENSTRSTDRSLHLSSSHLSQSMVLTNKCRAMADGETPP